MELKPDILEVLACPACKGSLKPHADHIDCATCGEIYAIENGIPVLIPGKANLLWPPKDSTIIRPLR